jgi:hypothetical protein
MYIHRQLQILIWGRYNQQGTLSCKDLLSQFLPIQLLIRQSDFISIGTSPEPMQHGCVKALLGQKVAVQSSRKYCV